MMSIGLINTIFKYTFLSFITFYIFSRSINYTSITKSKIIISFLASIFMGLIYSILINYIPSLLVILVLILLISIIITSISNIELEHSITVTFISMTIGLAFYMISLFITSMIVKLPFIDLNTDNPLILILTIIVEVLFITRLFKISRFKNGFSFL